MRCSSFLCCVTVPLASCHANKTNGNKPLTASSLARVRRKKLFGELMKLLNNIITGTENSEGEGEEGGRPPSFPDVGLVIDRQFEGFSRNERKRTDDENRQSISQ